MADAKVVTAPPAGKKEHEFVKAIGLFDGTMIVVGSMIGSGIFIVAAEISRQTGSAGGLLLTWVLTGCLTIAAAFPMENSRQCIPTRAGNTFTCGKRFRLYGDSCTAGRCSWSFRPARSLRWPSVSRVTLACFFQLYRRKAWMLVPINLGSHYAVSLSVQQLVAILMIVFLTFLNTRGVQLGKWIQNIFTSAKMLSLLGLILLCVFVARNHAAIVDNFTNLWAIRMRSRSSREPISFADCCRR